MPRGTDADSFRLGRLLVLVAQGGALGVRRHADTETFSGDQFAVGGLDEDAVHLPVDAAGERRFDDGAIHLRVAGKRLVDNDVEFADIGGQLGQRHDERAVPAARLEIFRKVVAIRRMKGPDLDADLVEIAAAGRGLQHQRTGAGFRQVEAPRRRHR